MKGDELILFSLIGYLLFYLLVPFKLFKNTEYEFIYILLNFQISKLKLHKIPEIDCAQRDPVIESYQNLGSKSLDKTTSDEDNEKENNETNEINETSQKQDDPDKMQVDVADDSDLDTKELPQYNSEQLVQMETGQAKITRATLLEEIRDLDKPNFKILEEFKKRVC